MKKLVETLLSNRVLLDKSLRGDLPGIQRLFKQHPHTEINCQDDSGATPLMMAVRGGHLDIVCFLLRNGANPLAKTFLGNSVLFWACLGHHDDAELVFTIFKSVDSAGIKKLISPNTSGETCLMSACSQNKPNICKALLELGVPLLSRCKKGNTAGHYAMKGGNHVCLGLLLDAGMDVYEKDGNGESVFDICQSVVEHSQMVFEKGIVECVMLVENHLQLLKSRAMKEEISRSAILDDLCKEIHLDSQHRPSKSSKSDSIDDSESDSDSDEKSNVEDDLDDESESLFSNRLEADRSRENMLIQNVSECILGDVRHDQGMRLNDKTSFKEEEFQEEIECECKQVLERTCPQAYALDINIKHLLGEDLECLSSSQLSILDGILAKSVYALAQIRQERQDSFRLDMENRIQELERRVLYR